MTVHCCELMAGLPSGSFRKGLGDEATHVGQQADSDSWRSRRRTAPGGRFWRKGADLNSRYSLCSSTVVPCRFA